MSTFGSSSPVEVSGMGLSSSHCLYSGVLLTVIIILALRTSEVEPPLDFLLFVIGGGDEGLGAMAVAPKRELGICLSTPVDDDVAISVDPIGIDFNDSCAIGIPDPV